MEKKIKVPLHQGLLKLLVLAVKHQEGSPSFIQSQRKRKTLKSTLVSQAQLLEVSESEAVDSDEEEEDSTSKEKEDSASLSGEIQGTALSRKGKGWSSSSERLRQI